MKWIVPGFLLIHLLLEFLCLSIDSEPEAIEQGEMQRRENQDMARTHSPSSRFARWGPRAGGDYLFEWSRTGLSRGDGPLP